MATFAEIMLADAEVITDPAEFGELVTYSPDGGGDATVRAAVTRHPIAQAGNVRRKEIEITVPNGGDYGPATITPGRDRVGIKWHIDDAGETWFVVSRVIGESAGAIRLALTGGKA